MHTRLAAVLIVAVAVPAVCVAQDRHERGPSTRSRYQWQQVTAWAAWEPRDGAGAVVFRDRLWHIGGWAPAIFPRITANDAWSTIDGLSWLLEKPNSFTVTFNAAADWEGRHSFGAVSVGDECVIVGGDASQGYYQNDVWASNNGRDWVLRANNVPWAPRVLMSVGVYQGRVVVIGGQTLPQKAPARDVRYRDVWVSDDAGATWTEIVPLGAYWLVGGMVDRLVEWRGRLWLVGGGAYSSPAYPDRVYSSQVWSTDDLMRWRLESVAPWTPRQYHNVLVWNDALWVIGGLGPDIGGRWRNLADTWYSTDGTTWTQVHSPWTARHAAAAWQIKGKIVLAGGNNPVTGGLPTSDVWQLVTTTTQGITTKGQQ